MFRMYASNSHSYTHLILALSIVREPTIWGFITSKYSGTHDIGLPNINTLLGPKRTARSPALESVWRKVLRRCSYPVKHKVLNGIDICIRTPSLLTQSTR